MDEIPLEIPRTIYTNHNQFSAFITFYTYLPHGLILSTTVQNHHQIIKFWTMTIQLKQNFIYFVLISENTFQTKRFCSHLFLGNKMVISTELIKNCVIFTCSKSPRKCTTACLIYNSEAINVKCKILQATALPFLKWGGKFCFVQPGIKKQGRNICHSRSETFSSLDLFHVYLP